MNAMGAPLTRVDGSLKVTGGTRYAAEFHPDGLAYAATHDSTVLPGRITVIDTASAEQAAGVLLVLTHLNADRVAYQAPAERPAVHPVTGEQLRVLQDAEIQFSGQPVALVVAATQAQAPYAASLVRVTYALDPDCRIRFDPALANVSTPCPMRGPGWATGLIGQEMAMDELTEKLKLDPIELRLRNHAERDPTKDLPWSSKALRTCYQQGAERFGWSRRLPGSRTMRNGRELVGLGMATAIYHVARCPTSASVSLFADGTVTVRCATTDMGPGTYTSATQVAADATWLDDIGDLIAFAQA